MIQNIKDPWKAQLDNHDPMPADLGRVAFGQNLTTTPEYLAANLPPYNQRHSAMIEKSLIEYLLIP